MKAAAFSYKRVTSLDEAFAAFATADDAAFLAGGQSLLPALSMRLQMPSLVIDIAHIKEASGIVLDGERLRIGALSRHNEVLTSPLVARHVPLLAKALPFVSHPAIRNRGTIGGSVALADPAAEYPALLLATDAEVEIASRDGKRIVAADDFFIDLFETALEPGEIITAVLFPLDGKATRHWFHEFTRRRGDYAMAGLAMQLEWTGKAEAARLAFLSLGPKALRARTAETIVTGSTLDDATIIAAQQALDADLEPMGDAHTSAEAKLHLAKVLLKRGLHTVRDGGQLS